MDKLLVDLRVKLFMKNIIAYGLSILLMASVIHVDYHVDVEQDGYNICKIGCEEQNHHSISHQCQKCLNNNQRLYFLTENELTKSISEARRLIDSGSVKIDDQKVELLDINSSDLIGKVLQVGKRKFLKINKK